MKKHLIAAAVAGALAVPAMAQVTVSGRIDAAYNVVETKTLGTPSTTEVTDIGISPMTSSRFILKAEEDLGGGLKAAMNIETGMGRSDSTKAQTGTTLGDRQFNVTLSGGFGSVLIGRTDSQVKSVYDAFDVAGSNNMVGSVDSLDEATNATTTRDVTVRYTTPAMSGVSVSVGFMKNTNETTGAVTSETASGSEIGLKLSMGPLAAAVAYRDVEDTVRAVAVDNAKFIPAVSASSADKKDLGLGASYDLGAAKLTLQYFDTENKNKLTNAKTEEQFTAVGVLVPLGAISVYASYVDGETKTGATKADREGYQIGAKYALSKRTYAYLAYGDEESKGLDEATQTAIGVVHNF
jgi:predicted porin